MWSLSIYSNCYKFFLTYFSPSIRMSRKNVNLVIKKSKKWLLRKQKVTKIADIDVNKILVCKEEPYGKRSSFKYFIGSNNNDVIRPLCIKLPQMTGYVGKF